MMSETNQTCSFWQNLINICVHSRWRVICYICISYFGAFCGKIQTFWSALKVSLFPMVKCSDVSKCPQINCWSLINRLSTIPLSLTPSSDFSAGDRWIGSRILLTVGTRNLPRSTTVLMVKRTAKAHATYQMDGWWNSKNSPTVWKALKHEEGLLIRIMLTQCWDCKFNLRISWHYWPRMLVGPTWGICCNVSPHNMRYHTQENTRSAKLLIKNAQEYYKCVNVFFTHDITQATWGGCTFIITHTKWPVYIYYQKYLKIHWQFFGIF